MTPALQVAILYRFPNGWFSCPLGTAAEPKLQVHLHYRIESRQPLMANIKSQIKRNRTNELARERNKAVRSEVKTRVKHAELAIAEGAENAEELTKVAVRAIDKATSKGVFHKNAAARRKSRLTRTRAESVAS